MRTTKCPKCQSTMIEGFIPVESSGLRALLGWSQGKPQRTWLGLKASGKPIGISSWRCQRCGFLENYANG